MKVDLEKRALPRNLAGQMPPELATAIDALPSAFGQASLGAVASNLDIKKLKGHSGLYRLRVGDWRAVFLRASSGLLVVAIGLRKDIYERVERLRLARKGAGLRIVEARVGAASGDADSPRERAIERRGPRRPSVVVANPLTPFADGELLSVSRADRDLVDWLRALPPTVDVGLVLGQRLEDADLVALLTDLWERPAHHLATFGAGRVPNVDDVVVDVDELSERIGADDSETEVVTTTSAAQMQRLLDGTIEEWMVYLHPSQRVIARAAFNGPARVRGGPGTGKTVVALHRARRLAREAPDGQRVLLTTFLRNLPQVWTGLMGLMDPKALERLDVVNLDRLVVRILRDATGSSPNIIADEKRQSIAKGLLERHGLARVMAGNPSLLLEEFDAFLSGRGVDDLDDYLALRRRGGGSPLGRADRERVWAAYGEYRVRLGRAVRSTGVRHGPTRSKPSATVTASAIKA